MPITRSDRAPVRVRLAVLLALQCTVVLVCVLATTLHGGGDEPARQARHRPGRAAAQGMPARLPAAPRRAAAYLAAATSGMADEWWWAMSHWPFTCSYT